MDGDEVTTSAWPVEPIPDGDRLFYAIHKMWLRKDGTRVAPECFENRPDERTGAMSTDWERYSTAEEARQRRRVPSDNAIGMFVAGQLRAIPDQTVMHSPLPDNRAHTDIGGPKETADLDVQAEFARIVEIVGPLGR